jgi:hypothetical protein
MNAATLPPTIGRIIGDGPGRVNLARLDRQPRAHLDRSDRLWKSSLDESSGRETSQAVLKLAPRF